MNIWIPGGNGAIGGACSHVLMDAGRHHVFTGSADVQSQMEVSSAVEGREIDALVYAAGVNYLAWSDSMDTLQMNWVYDVNVVGLIRCLRAAKDIKKCVVIGSDAATRPMRTSVAYNASKAALHAAVKCIARERAHELQINVVAPGLIHGTDMTDYVSQRTAELRPELDLDEYMIGQIPMGRAGRPEEVAEVVRWLLEDSPEYLNGSIIEVNGGR